MNIEFVNGNVILSRDDFINLLADSEQLNALHGVGLAEWNRYEQATKEALDFEGVENFEILAERKFRELLTDSK